MRTLADLVRTVGDGQTHTFARVVEPTGDEVAYYSVSTAGEFGWSPAWRNAPDRKRYPRPPVMSFGSIPLDRSREQSFDFPDTAGNLAEIYRIGTGLYLVSDKVVNLLLERDPGGLEVAQARIETEDGVVDHFNLVVPTRVVDGIDVEKSTILVTRTETLKGSGVYQSRFNYHGGFVMRADITDVPSFVGALDPDWWWREDVVRAAVDARVMGLSARPSRKSALRPEVNIVPTP